jgi:DNA invertase Pin-like site-specific DNA recombinase
MSGDVAAYIRVSSDKQDTTRQRESVEGAAQQLGFAIDHWFQDSEGKNSRDLPHKRLAFKRMMAAVERRELRLVIVDSQDRFGTRDAAQFGSFITHFRDNGCSLFDATGRDLSADDDGAVLTTTIGALTSTREQREKGRRCLGGMVEHAKRGHYVGGYPPYGLDVVCFGSDAKEKWRSLYVGHFDRWKVYPNGTREHYKGKDNAPKKDREDVFHYRPSNDAARLRIVKDVFHWYATEAISPRQIATRLNELKINPIFGEQWDKMKILQLLRNPVYIGRPKWNKRAGSRFVPTRLVLRPFTHCSGPSSLTRACGADQRGERLGELAVVRGDHSGGDHGQVRRYARRCPADRVESARRGLSHECRG